MPLCGTRVACSRACPSMLERLFWHLRIEYRVPGIIVFEYIALGVLEYLEYRSVLLTTMYSNTLYFN